MKNKVMTVVFFGVLAAGMVVNLVTPDRSISRAERRELAQAPQIDRELLLSGEGGQRIEEYLLDQFWQRELFRGIKVGFDRFALQKSDSGGLYRVGDYLFQMEYPLKEESITKVADKIKSIEQLYLAECRSKAIAVIPDKSHYLPPEDAHLSLSYQAMEQLLRKELPEMEYLPLEGLLQLSDYYRTDLHWKQEELPAVAEAIWTQFERSFDAGIWEGLQANTYQPFYGAYYGQMGGMGDGDTLTWLTHPVIEKMQITDFDQMKKHTAIYDEQKLTSVDAYELFLSGNSPLIVIDNPACADESRLIVFRDSFASPLAPLLALNYSQVVLVDLRFMGYEVLGQFVDFTQSDVLFLYSQPVYNNADMLRKR